MKGVGRAVGNVPVRALVVINFEPRAWLIGGDITPKYGGGGVAKPPHRGIVPMVPVQHRAFQGRGGVLE